MNQFPPEELISFLQVTDNYLTKRCDLIIIGGAAASLAYGVTRTTSDIDSISQIPDHLANALDLANAKTGFSIPVSYVGVFEPPYDYKVRLSPLENLALTKLQLFVPEKHDLALMKIVRGYENDIQVIEEIHQNFPLEFDILVGRFMNEMTQVIGDLKSIRLNFLVMIEVLFGDEQAQEAAKISENRGSLN